MDFQVGDVVVLKSGGPTMTIEATDEDGWLCTWFDKDGRRQRGVFGPQLLQKE